MSDLSELRRLLALASPTDRELAERDRLVYGVGYLRRRPDGSVEHVPATEIVALWRDAPRCAQHHWQHRCVRPADHAGEHVATDDAGDEHRWSEP